MFFQFAKKLAAVAMAAVMVLSMAACSGEDSAAEEEAIDKKMAAQGGSITLPEGLAMPDTDATMLTDFSGGQMSGVFKTINSQQTKYFKQNEQLIEAQRIRQRTEYDIEMLRQAGFSFAMENAGNAVVAAAKYRAGSNNREGVLDVIDKVLKHEAPFDQ